MRVVLVASAAAAAVSLPAVAFAVEYQTADVAARRMFPDADTFDTRAVTPDAAVLRQLDAQNARGSSREWTVRVARHGGALLGYVVVDRTIGKAEAIDFAVALTPDGTVKAVEILAYRESYGHEIRLPSWRKQFVGKTAAAPMRIGDDIANISGATLSCTHVTEAIRRIVAMVTLLRRAEALPT
ncbi:MAG: FMN-binding protein [Mitsuaria chitosanitabida]|uniref:FMN-binding protein n=1 Tax=Roseateles chitosanitabidus TaxID=65048 RepID=UPI001B0C33AC|nr:FMN-binding protein [Roseateles chitosanitabidus]MBO9687510.1 FMN-binding protein [Roseateles chitosanitabidus]